MTRILTLINITGNRNEYSIQRSYLLYFLRRLVTSKVRHTASRERIEDKIIILSKTCYGLSTLATIVAHWRL